MVLPNVDSAIVERSKIVDYLLASEKNTGKAEFFTSFGFRIEKWQAMARALIAHARDNEVTRSMTNQHGVKYIIEGRILTPDGRNPLVRSVWIIENHSIRPRLVTAYRLKGR